MQGRLEQKTRHIEKFCKKCKKKFYVDTKPDFFTVLDKYKIKQSLKGGPTQRFCASCTMDFVLANTSLTEFF